MSEVALRVDGLQQFVKDLKKIDSELPKKVRLALNEAANTVVDRARPGIPKRSGKAARSVKAQSTRTAARVSGGGGRVPYYPWLDFGGRVGRNNSVHRPFRSKGRYIYKAYFDARRAGEFDRMLVNALTDVVRSAGLELE